MEISIQIARNEPDGESFWLDRHSVDIERELLSASSRLKSVVCSRLLGEISARQFDLLRSDLLRQIRLLKPGAPEFS